MNKSKRIQKRTNKKRTNKKRTRRFRNKKSIGGVKIYTEKGDFEEDPQILHDGKDFFRKMKPNTGEKEICELLMKNPHKNIIKIYAVTDNYIDMELLNVDINTGDISKLQNEMMEVKTYLQELGIFYIDWKLDNIGISNDGEFKLFDFDVSGLMDIKTKEWKVEPPKYFAYNRAVHNGMKTPIEIDNYAFEQGIR